MKAGRALAAELVSASRLLHERGWVANHDGNVTAKDGARILATPTATSKRQVTEASLVQLDASGQVVAGTGRVFGEIGLHLTVYERRPDVAAVVHAHPPMATAIASSRGGAGALTRPFLPEAVVSLGPILPRVALALPGDPARAALAPWCEWVDAVLLANHGVMAWGASVEQALLRLELVEHLARIAVAAAPLGGVEPLPEELIRALMPARAKAGLGRAADRAVETVERWLGSSASAASSGSTASSASAAS
ncbi:MAG TPA: class II aldolase/adducin family protein, partial [Kofleriaceae bacterium]|nr:class II aldolase/adducin family protein [Kofleriaceae bacterium]